MPPRICAAYWGRAMAELRRCPFCRRKARLEDCIDLGSNTFCQSCWYCGARGPLNSVNEYKDAWNRRTDGR